VRLLEAEAFERPGKFSKGRSHPDTMTIVFRSINDAFAA
jgi:hypothetical protein